MNIPEVILQYFQSKNEHNAEGLLAVFAENAIVFDRGEDKQLQGTDQIKAWIEKSLSGLNLKTEIKDCIQGQDVWIIETIVSGDFKVSPAKFTYKIKLDDSKISFLDIEFGGTAQFE